MMIRVQYPCRTVSALNAREHPMARARRVKRERLNAWLSLRQATADRPALPLAITVTRIAPRALDRHDNLGASLKPTIDGIADFLGVADNDPRVTFKTAQERGIPKFYGIRIEVDHVE